MATFLLYELMTKEKLQRFKKEFLNGITKWFDDNPKRRVCRVKWVYGEEYTIKRKNFADQIEELVKNTRTK